MKKKDQQKYTDYITNKVLLAFTVGVMVIMILLNIYRMMSKIVTYTSSRTVTDVLFVASLVISGLGVVKLIFEKIKHKNLEFKLFTGSTIIIIGAFCAICFGVLSLRYDPSTFTMLYAGVPAAVVLYIIYYCFDPAFFIVSLLSVSGSICSWLIYMALQSTLRFWLVIPIGGTFALLLILVLIGVIASFQKKPINFFGYSIEFLPTKNSNGVILGAMSVALANVIAAFVLTALKYLFNSLLLLVAPLAYFVLATIYFVIMRLVRQK